MKVMQVFDCIDMPRIVRDAFYARNEGTANDCYVNWYVGDLGYGEVEDVQNDMVDSWLKTQTKELDSEVLIQHWW
jgi:hypothetical protein